MERTRPTVVGELIEDRAKRLDDKVFLRFKDRTFTYREIDRLSSRYAMPYALRR